MRLGEPWLPCERDILVCGDAEQVEQLGVLCVWALFEGMSGLVPLASVEPSNSPFVVVCLGAASLTYAREAANDGSYSKALSHLRRNWLHIPVRRGDVLLAN